MARITILIMIAAFGFIILEPDFTSAQASRSDPVRTVHRGCRDLSCSLVDITIDSVGCVSFTVEIRNTGRHPVFLPEGRLDRDLLESLRLWPIDEQRVVQIEERGCAGESGEIRMLKLMEQNAIRREVRWDPSCSGLTKVLDQNLKPDGRTIEQPLERISGDHFAASLQLFLTTYDKAPVDVRAGLLDGTCSVIPCANVMWVRRAKPKL